MFEINLHNGQFYYDLFYFLAILFAGVAFIDHGKRKKYPMTEWSLIYASAIIFLIVGTKLLTYSVADWEQVFTTGEFPYTASKTILGGIVGGIFGVWLVTKVLRFKYPVLDAFAVSFPLAMGIQRIGCFLAGCCYGSPTNVPWSVRYGEYNLPYFVHLDRGSIEVTDQLSLAIHPNQMYQTLLCFGIAFFIWKIRDRLKRPGDLFFSSVALYLVVRIIIEFTRDDTTQGLAENLWMGMNRVQWILSGIVPILAAFIYFRERKYKPQIQVISQRKLSLWYFVFLCLFMLLAGSWFTKVEGFYIAVVLIPTTLYCIHEMADIATENYKLKLLSIYTLLFGLLGIGFITAQKEYNELTSSDTSRNVFHEWSVGFGSLGYGHYHAPPMTTVSSGCSGPVTNSFPSGPLFQHRSNVFGSSFKHIETYGKYEKFTFSGEIAAGWDSELNSTNKNTNWIWDASPSVNFTTHWLQFGAGLRLGSNFKEEIEENLIYVEDHELKVYGHFAGRLTFGPYERLYAGISQNEFFPYQMGHRGNIAPRFVIGTGLGFKDGSGIEYGSGTEFGESIALKFYVDDNFGIKAMYMDGGEYTEKMWQISLNHRFHKKQTSRPVTD